MLTGLGILGVVVVACLAALVIRAIRRRIDVHGILLLLWRWHSGATWHGKPLTDAGWFRPATDRKALTPTGHAPRFWYRPRWQRAARRSGRSLAAVLLLLAWVSYGRPAEVAAVVLSLALAAFGCWRGWLRWQGRKQRRTWAEPLHLVAAPLVGIPRALPASSWLV